MIFDEASNETTLMSSSARNTRSVVREASTPALKQTACHCEKTAPEFTFQYFILSLVVAIVRVTSVPAPQNTRLEPD